MIQYIATATIPFLAAVALVSNKNRQVHVLSSDKSTVRATVEHVTITQPRSDASVTLTLLADDVLPGVLSHQGQESIQVNIPGTDDYQTFVVRQISSN